MRWQPTTMPGRAWRDPGQRVEWDIGDPSGDSAGRPRGRAGGWRSSLRLTLPKLGAVPRRGCISPAGVSLHFVADEGRRQATAARPRQTGRSPGTASVPMTGMSVEVTARRPTMAKPEEAPAKAEAVALAYTAGEAAPPVVAKGPRTDRQQIIRRAREAGVVRA